MSAPGPGYFTPYKTAYATPYHPGSAPQPPPAPPDPAPGTPAPGVNTGYFTPYKTAYATPYHPGATPAVAPILPGTGGTGGGTGGTGTGTGNPGVPGTGPTGYFTPYKTPYATPYHPGALYRAAPVYLYSPDLPSAVLDALVADAGLLTLLGAGPYGSSPRKVWNELAPQRLAAPYLVFAVQPSPRSRSSGGIYLTDGTLTVTAYAATGPSSRSLADRAQATLRAWADSGAVRFAEGRLMDLWLASAMPAPDFAHAAGHGRTWAETRTFGFKYQGPAPPSP